MTETVITAAFRTPLGSYGARILTTLLHKMTARSLKRGLATLCIGGGMGTAICAEREET